jgi:hypothetical protein
MAEYAPRPRRLRWWDLVFAALPGRQAVHAVLRAGRPGDPGWSDPLALIQPDHRGSWSLGWYRLLLHGSDMARAMERDGQVPIDPPPGEPPPTAAGRSIRVYAGMAGR